MRIPIKRIGAAVTAALVLSVCPVTGCAANKESQAIKDESGLVLSGKMPETLPEGLSWYDFHEESGIFDMLKETVGEYFLINVTWFNGRTWMFVCETEPKTAVYHVVSFDENNNLVSDYVIKDEYGDSIAINSMDAGNALYLSAYDFSTGKDYLYPVDEVTGTASPDNRIELNQNSSQYEASVRFAFVGDDVALLQNGDEPCVELVDLAAGKVKKKVSLENLNRDFNIKYPENIICAGGNKVVVSGITSANWYFGQTRYCLVDFEAGSIKALDEMDYITVPLRNLTYCNGGLVTVTDGGVYSIDTAAGTCTMILSFNCSNCNRFLVNNSELKYADDNMLMFSYSSRYVGLGQLNDVLCVFTKSSDYPAAGKSILTVASTEDLDYSISEAIMEFNNQSSSSYMLFDSRYKANAEIDYSNVDSTDRAAVNSLNAYASVSDRLTMDIIAGNGPDILISNGANEQLSKSEYFIDLSDYLENESGINESDYFMNAINAMRFNGSLYQLPIGFYVEGFIAPSDAVNGKNGLTFDEYLSMVSSSCNGQDPIWDHQLSYSRNEVATKLFANSNEVFIKEGKIDVNCTEFQAILDYCKDLPEKGFFEGKDIDAEYEDLMSAKESMKVQPVVIYGFYEYEAFVMKNKNALVFGYPSADGRTATIGSEIAVSVSACSSDINSCKEFINILLSEHVQSTIATNIPVNKNCARDLAVSEIAVHNRNVNENAGEMFAKTGEALDTSLADEYIEQLSEASTSAFVYHSISLIIYEEIPAYFEGQKTFEEVAQVINDRAQKVLDERK